MAPIPIPIESGSGEIRGRLVGHLSAHESFCGIGISLRAPQTPRPRPPPPELWRVNIDDVRMEQQLLS